MILLDSTKLKFVWIKIKKFFKRRVSIIKKKVTSLFTNTPLQKTIDTAINLIFNHNPNLNITRKELKKLFLFSTSQAHFVCNSKFYNQIGGLAMGSQRH